MHAEVHVFFLSLFAWDACSFTVPGASSVYTKLPMGHVGSIKSMGGGAIKSTA